MLTGQAVRLFPHASLVVHLYGCLVAVPLHVKPLSHAVFLGRLVVLTKLHVVSTKLVTRVVNHLRTKKGDEMRI